MAVNDNRRDEPFEPMERDPALARLLAAAPRDEPPAALDAAILAAARREVGARPLALGGAPSPGVNGGGGETGAPPVRAKRNWYVPVSIAAVMVLSVSLVSIVQHEKGDELAQPPVATRPLPAAKAPVAAEAPSAPSAPSSARASTQSTVKQDATLRDAVSPKFADEKLGEPAKRRERGERSERAEDSAAPPSVPAPVSPDGYAALARKERAEKAGTASDRPVAAVGANKDQADSGATREQRLGDSTRETKSVATMQGQVVAGAAAPPVVERAPMEARREAEAVRPAPERAPAPFPAQSTAQAPASRDDAASRSEADRNAGPSMKSAPAAAAAPVAPPPAPAPRLAAKVASKPAAALAPQRVPVWRGLEDQPPEKWLERLAEFKRDNRQADADELLAEFRRRFPDHPLSVR